MNPNEKHDIMDFILRTGNKDKCSQLDLPDLATDLMELAIEMSDMEQAMQVINHIKSL